jgi:hypothetical protein
MANIARWQDPETGHIFTLEYEHAKRLGYRLYGAREDDAPVDIVPEPLPEGAEYPRHVGGRVYELSDGSRAKGKDAAIEAEARLLALQDAIADAGNPIIMAASDDDDDEK